MRGQIEDRERSVGGYREAESTNWSDYRRIQIVREVLEEPPALDGTLRIDTVAVGDGRDGLARSEHDAQRE